MYKKRTVSLVFPAYNEEKNIEAAIKEFKEIDLFDEIIVVNNNSTDDTKKIAKKYSVRVVDELKQGYGYAIIRGLKEVNGDYIVVSEPDGTFVASDSLRFMKLLEKYDLVFGTRTNKRFIQKGSNMGFFLRFGNIILAKTLQYLFKTCYLSDCGCTFRAMRRKTAQLLAKKATVGSSHLLPETVILSHLNGASCIEIPVHYKKRVGESKITGSIGRSFKVGLRMAILIFAYRFGLN